MIGPPPNGGTKALGLAQSRRCPGLREVPAVPSRLRLALALSIAYLLGVLGVLVLAYSVCPLWYVVVSSGLAKQLTLAALASSLPGVAPWVRWYLLYVPDALIGACVGVVAGAALPQHWGRLVVAFAASFYQVDRALGRSGFSYGAPMAIQGEWAGAALLCVAGAAPFVLAIAGGAIAARTLGRRSRLSLRLLGGWGSLATRRLLGEKVLVARVLSVTAGLLAYTLFFYRVAVPLQAALAEVSAFLLRCLGHPGASGYYGDCPALWINGRCCGLILADCTYVSVFLMLAPAVWSSRASLVKNAGVMASLLVAVGGVNVSRLVAATALDIAGWGWAWTEPIPNCLLAWGPVVVLWLVRVSESACRVSCADRQE